jgi:hypothetical protein
VDLARSRFTEIANRIGDDTGVNGLAYNTLDDFLYARQGGKNHLVSIGSDGTTEPIATFSNGNFVNAGDIDTDGCYWYGYTGSAWYQLDLRPNSTIYGILLANGRMDTLGLNIADWAYIPVGGPYLSTVAGHPSGGTALARFNMNTKTWEIIQRYPRIGGNTWGAV